MESRKLNFDAAIAELESGDQRQKHGKIELLVSPAKIQAELLWPLNVTSRIKRLGSRHQPRLRQNMACSCAIWAGRAPTSWKYSRILPC